MRYFVHLGFDGSHFNGWQRQKNASNTIQETIEDTLTKIFKKEISVYGCGRTDAGVHASQYIMQLHLDEAPEFDLQFRLNKNLPDSIVIYEIHEVQIDQHCRYDAISRTYDYFIHLKKDPALLQFSSLYEDLQLDFSLMQQAVQLIRETSDFKALCKRPDLYTNTSCEISNCELFINSDQSRLRFTIKSDRFLRGMIRYCIFFLLKVGTQEISLDEFEAILEQEKSLKDKQPAHPNGLYLSKIEYPFIQFENKHHLIKMLKQDLA